MTIAGNDSTSRGVRMSGNRDIFLRTLFGFGFISQVSNSIADFVIATFDALTLCSTSLLKLFSCDENEREHHVLLCFLLWIDISSVCFVAIKVQNICYHWQ